MSEVDWKGVERLMRGRRAGQTLPLRVRWSGAPLEIQGPDGEAHRREPGDVGILHGWEGRSWKAGILVDFPPLGPEVCRHRDIEPILDQEHPDGIVTTRRVDQATEAELEGFFEGWPDAPSAGLLGGLLMSSYVGVVARDGDLRGPIVGFVTAISDGLLAAYLPLLEVRQNYRGRGIGRLLVKHVLADLGDLYMVDVVCDEDVVGFYERLGFQRYRAMIRRNRGALSDQRFLSRLLLGIAYRSNQVPP